MDEQERDEQERKSALRRSARDARRSLADDERQRATAAIVERLRRLPELASTQTVLVYAAAHGEVDVEDAAAVLRDRGAVTLYPRVRGEALDLVPVSDVTSLIAGHRDILEPQGPGVDPAVVDAVLVPGVAFDLRGGRLGQGGGHYDRLLPRIGDAVRIGVAFACQVVPWVPRNPQDVAIDVLVTESSVHRVDREEAR